MLSPVAGGRGKVMLRVDVSVGQDTRAVVVEKAVVEDREGGRARGAPRGVRGGPGKGEGDWHLPGRVRQERGGGVVVVVEEGVGEVEVVGVRVGVGEAVPQPAAVATPGENPVPGGQGRGSVVLEGQKDPRGH